MRNKRSSAARVEERRAGNRRGRGIRRCYVRVWCIACVMCGQYNLHLTRLSVRFVLLCCFLFPLPDPLSLNPVTVPFLVTIADDPLPPRYHACNQGGVLTLTLIPTSVYNVSSIDASITDLFNTASEYTVVWEVVGYVLIAFAIILIGVFIYCRKAVQQAIDIISEACKAVAAAPLIVFWPIITTAFILILAGTWQRCVWRTSGGWARSRVPLCVCVCVCVL